MLRSGVRNRNHETPTTDFLCDRGRLFDQHAAGERSADRPGDRATLEAVAAFEALAEDKPADAMKILDANERIPNIPPDRLAVLPIARAVVLLGKRIGTQ